MMRTTAASATPEPVKHLFRSTSLKLSAQRLGITKVEASANGGKLNFAEATEVEPMELVKLVQTQSATYQLASATTLKFSEEMEDYRYRFEFIEQLIETLTPDHLRSAA